MKKFFTRFAAVAMTLVAAFSFVACEEDKVEEVAVSDATVEVAVTAKDAQSATFAITTTKAEAVAYYRTTDTKFIATGDFVFKNGKEVEPNTTVSVSMPYLEEMSDYRLVVAARAANGASGEEKIGVGQGRAEQVGTRIVEEGERVKEEDTATASRVE